MVNTLGTYEEVPSSIFSTNLGNQLSGVDNLGSAFRAIVLDLRYLKKMIVYTTTTIISLKVAEPDWVVTTSLPIFTAMQRCLVPISRIEPVQSQEHETSVMCQTWQHISSWCPWVTIARPLACLLGIFKKIKKCTSAITSL